jgi:hypothetical protein
MGSKRRNPGLPVDPGPTRTMPLAMPDFATTSQDDLDNPR